jgi:hypothetical protein
MDSLSASNCTLAARSEAQYSFPTPALGFTLFSPTYKSEVGWAEHSEAQHSCLTPALGFTLLSPPTKAR